MKRLFKIISLLSVIAFVISCQAKSVNSNFEVVDVNQDLTPEISVPSDKEDEVENPGINEGLTALTEQELSIKDINDFNIHLNGEPIYRALGIGLNFNSQRINSDIFNDKTKTQVETKLTLLEYKGGSLDLLKKGVEIVRYQEKFNEHVIRYHYILRDALPMNGTYAKYRVDLYIKDLRKSDNKEESNVEARNTTDGKQYLVTHRYFEFTVYGADKK